MTQIDKSGAKKFVKIVKRLFAGFTVTVFIAIMIFLSLAFNLKGLPQIVYGVTAGALILLFFVVYALYSTRVSMGTVVSLLITEKAVHVKTSRKDFVYDVRGGCVAVKTYPNRYVCTFETSDSRDKFIFYRHAPFSKYSDGQFGEEEICMFCPDFDGEDYTK